ncbi:MAG: phosphotransferase [Lentisphaeria bacterium]|nr:phosphotransferase [Lentisphaeria bacterium]
MSSREGLEIVAAALAHYAVGAPRRVRRHAGTAGKTWRIATDTGRYLLRVRGPRTSAETLVAWDHALRRHLVRAGFPTAEPLLTREGAGCVRLGDRAVELYALLPGTARRQVGLAEIAAAARGLAAFHRAGLDFPLATALPPVAQYSTLGIAEASGRMEDPVLLARFYGGLEGEVGSGPCAGPLGLARHWLRRLEVELSDAAYGALPQALTHGDYTLANLLFRGRNVVGVFDFDWARWAPRIRDVADGLCFVAGRRVVPLRAGDIWSLTTGIELDVLRSRHWLAAYQDAWPLDPAEWDAIPLALAARWLSIRAEGTAKVPKEDRLRFALAQLPGPLQWLEDQWPRVREGG